LRLDAHNARNAVKINGEAKEEKNARVEIKMLVLMLMLMLMLCCSLRAVANYFPRVRDATHRKRYEKDENGKA
jgi:hypothetical protein